jgi:DNA invertase Pin-like site-specific DNA recombinase
MKLDYARFSKADGSQTHALKVNALMAARVKRDQIYTDEASGKLGKRPDLEACLKACQPGDVLHIWILGRLERDLKHLVLSVSGLSERSIGLNVIIGQGANIDTTTARSKLVFGIFAPLAEFEGDFIRERTMAGLAAARTHGCTGSRGFGLSNYQIRFSQSGMANSDTLVTDLCKELNISRATPYRYVSAKGELRKHGEKALGG